MAMNQQIDWITEDINKKLALEIRRKLFASEELFDEMIRQIIIDERAESALIGMNSIFELMIITKQSTDQMKERISKFELVNENQKYLVACVFSFVYLTTQLLVPCPRC